MLAVPPSGSRELAFELAGPNPVHGASALFAILPEPATVSVTLHDLEGRVVRTLQPPTSRPAGMFSLPVDFSAQPAGVYFCRLLVGGRSIARKLVVAR